MALGLHFSPILPRLECLTNFWLTWFIGEHLFVFIIALHSGAVCQSEVDIDVAAVEQSECLGLPVATNHFSEIHTLLSALQRSFCRLTHYLHLVRFVHSENNEDEPVAKTAQRQFSHRQFSRFKIQTFQPKK